MRIEIVTINLEKVKNLKEVLHKEARPYYCKVELDEIYVALIPFRSNISHKHSFKTDEYKGIDYTKSIILNKNDLNDYKQEVVSIDNKQWKVIKSNVSRIEFTYRNYINKYKKEILKNNIDSTIIKFSTLQNYHSELGLEEN